jgi:hypothetical protein
MPTIVLQDFCTNLLKLLSEAFEGPPPLEGSAFLDKGGGLFQTLATVTAARASRAPAPGAPTLAAHCIHLGYYARTLHEFMRGGRPRVDWPSSWEVQTVSDEQWTVVCQELRDTYASLVVSIRAVETWADEEIGDSLAILAHTAYHLGAIRQLLRFVPEA